MSEELDDPQVLKRLGKRFVFSILAALVSAVIGVVVAFVIYPIVVGGLGLKFFTGWGAFLWLELGAFVSGVIGFSLCRRRLRRLGLPR